MTASPDDHERRLQALRRLRFAFVPFEAGAPSVDPGTPFGSADALADLALLAPGRDRQQRLYAEAMNDLPAFVAAAAHRLKPGRYVLDAADTNHLRDIFEKLAPLGAPPAAPKDFGVTADGGFDYTAEHAAILPRLRWQTPRGDALQPDQAVPARDDDTGETYWPVLTVDPKRPYGDMSYAEADMAEALGLEAGRDAQGLLPQKMEARLTALHWTTPAALRVLVLYGAA